MFWEKRNSLNAPEPESGSRELPGCVDLLSEWFWEESVWASNYAHELERRLYDLKQRCKKCPYRDKEGSGCHNQIPE